MGMIGNTLAQGLISGANIQDGTVDTVDLKDGSVTTAKIADGAVNTVDIANGAVTPAKLSTGSPFWDTSGNFGIGTSSPGFQLDLGNGTTVNNRVRLQRGSDDSSQYMTLGWNNISVYRNVPLASAQTDFALKQVGSDGTRTALYVDTSGNLGVGTTSPSQKFSIGFADASSGLVEFRSATYAKLAQIEGVDENSGGNGRLAFYTRSGGSVFERARIDPAGKFGIGKTPIAMFDVSLTGTANIATTGITKITDFAATSSFGFGGLANNNDGVFFGMGAGGNNGIPAGIGFMRESSGWNTAIAFYTNSVTSGPNGTNAMQEKLRIDSSGRVLINMISSQGSPVGQLQLYESSAQVGIDVRSGQAGSGSLRQYTTTMIEGSGANSGSSGNVAIKFHHNDYYQLSGDLSIWTKNNSNTQLQRLTVGADGTIIFNAYGSGSLSTNSSGVVSASDGRFKTKTRGIQNALDAVVQLGRLATFYRWDDDSPWHTEYEELGWFAQDVAGVIPEASPEPESPLETGDDGKPYTLRYKNYHDRAILAYMAKAIEELKAEFDAYKAAHP